MSENFCFFPWNLSLYIGISKNSIKKIKSLHFISLLNWNGGRNTAEKLIFLNSLLQRATWQLRAVLFLQVFGSWPVHCRDFPTAFFLWLLPHASLESTGIPMSCSSALQPCVLTLGSLAVLPEHCAMLWSPVCTLALTLYVDFLPSMLGVMAMVLYSYVDTVYIAPVIFEPSQLFFLTSDLSHGDMRGMSLLGYVLSIAGPGHLSPGSILQGCQPLPDPTLGGSPSACLIWEKCLTWENH